MQIRVNTKQKPKKKTLPDVGDLFTYPNTNFDILYFLIIYYLCYIY